MFFVARGVRITLPASLLPRFAFDLCGLTSTGLYAYRALPHLTVPSTAQGCCWLGLNDVIPHPLLNLLEPFAHRPFARSFPYSGLRVSLQLASVVIVVIVVVAAAAYATYLFLPPPLLHHGVWTKQAPPKLSTLRPIRRPHRHATPPRSSQAGLSRDNIAGLPHLRTHRSPVFRRASSRTRSAALVPPNL